MAEPVVVSYLALTTLLGDAYSRFVSLLSGSGATMRERLNSIQSSLSRIEASIANQDTALVRAAMLALKDGETDVALNQLRHGLEAYPLQPGGWTTYAAIMALKGNQERALEISKQIVSWFGLDCPVLPEEIRNAKKQELVLSASGNVEREIVALSHEGQTDIVVSARGIAAGFMNQVGFKFAFIDTRAKFYEIHFSPWTEPAPEETRIIHSENNNGLDTTTVRGMTDRFLIVNDRTVVDLDGVYPTKELSPSEVKSIFGDLSYSRWSGSRKHGVEIARDRKEYTYMANRWSASGGYLGKDQMTSTRLRLTATVKARG